MAKISQMSGQYFIFAATTTWDPIGNSACFGYDSQTAEANNNVIYRNAGVLNDLYAHVYQNTVNGTSTVRVRKNNANGNSTISIGSSATGEFQDSSNSDTISAGDTLNYQTVGGGSSGSAQGSLSTVFAATVNTKTHHINTVTSDFNGISTTYYSPIEGQESTTNTTEADAQFRYNSSASLANLYTYVGVNTNITATTLRMRKNLADGNLTVSCTGLTTGAFEDITNTDTVVATDDVNWRITTGVTVTDFIFDLISVESISTDNTFSSIAQNISSTGSLGANTTHYDWFGGLPGSSGNTEADVQSKILVSCTAGYLFVYVKTNSRSDASTYDFRKNATSTSISISITASTTGKFTDTSHTSSLTSTDKVNYRMVTGAGTGTILYNPVGSMLTSVASTFQNSNFFAFM